MVGIDATRTVRGAVAGALAAGVWAAQQPLDKRVFGSRYDDVELLGKAATRGGPGWVPAGTALHLGNGALFGAVYANVAPLVPIPPWAKGPAAALVEHVASWPLGRVSDAVHPARDELPQLIGDRRAFWQAAWRHLLFGLLLGEIERRLNAEPEELPSDYEVVVSSNGHGTLDHAVAVPPAP